MDEFEDDIPSCEETTALVIADPLQPGAYLPAAFQCHREHRAKGRLILHPALVTIRGRAEAGAAARAFARALEEDLP